MRTLIFSTLLTLGLTVAASQAAEAKDNYAKYCSKCHGADGRGQTKMGKQAGAKDYTDPKTVAEINEQRAFDGIKNGLTVKGKEIKKPMGDKLSDDEIKALVAHMRTFKK
jgi:cytochrome c553